MNYRFDWISVAVIAALLTFLVVGYRLLPSEGWLGRIGRGGILVFTVLIVALTVWNAVVIVLWRVR